VLKITKKIAIIGAGGLAREVSSYLQAVGYEIVAFRETPRHSNEKVHGALVVEHENERLKNVPHVIALGDTVAKHNLLKQYYQGYTFPALAPRNVYIGKNAKMRNGVFCCPGVILTCDCLLKDFAFINIQSIVAHDVSIGKYVTVNPNCSINGRVEIGDGAYLGSDVTVRDGVKIGEWAVVGMGSVVVDDVPDYVVAYGSPCRVVRKNCPKLV